MALHPDLFGRVALATGGGGGIGRAIALSLAEARAALAVNFGENREAADATVRDIEKLDGRALAIQADVSAPGGTRRSTIVPATGAICDPD